MSAIKKEQIKSIYALGASLGIVGRDKKEDELHILVAGVTGKDKISDLTEAEGKKVVSELMLRMRLSNHTAPPKRKAKTHETKPNSISERQQKMIWALMYQLRDCDIESKGMSLGERLAGIIRKHLHIDATAQRPFAWLAVGDAQRLINIIEAYIQNEKKKQGGAAKCKNIKI